MRKGMSARLAGVTMLVCLSSSLAARAADDAAVTDAGARQAPALGGPAAGDADKTIGEVWIDVRSAREYQAGHLPGAHHLPHERIAEGIGAIAPDPDTPIRLYCRSGARAAEAKAALEKLGYTRVENRGAYKTLLKAATH